MQKNHIESFMQTERTVTSILSFLFYPRRIHSTPPMRCLFTLCSLLRRKCGRKLKLRQIICLHKRTKTYYFSKQFSHLYYKCSVNLQFSDIYMWKQYTCYRLFKKFNCVALLSLLELRNFNTAFGRITRIAQQTNKSLETWRVTRLLLFKKYWNCGSASKN